jgi:hypothetical protein
MIGLMIQSNVKPEGPFSSKAITTILRKTTVNPFRKNNFLSLEKTKASVPMKKRNLFKNQNA